MRKPAKTSIPYAELVQKVQSLLANYPQEFRNIHVDGIEVYRDQQDGANWHVARYRRSGDDNGTECREKIAAEIRQVRIAYDVAQD